MDVKMILLIALGAFLMLVLSAKVLSAPLRMAVKALINTLLGLGALLVVNATGSITGLTLGFNLFNAAVVGVFGVPGLGLLFLMQWVLT